ncbi:MAG: Tpt1/KptA family RNA 2'-phosphotransferase [Hyperionvirus sp.]|uniref:Tpt1/KptA family RNA 2'-phosphotransferase n=1 Tax=Hyperionvirus sp. TaxID=2487770 RepID=A0A3G5A8T0_9VIRU|nr:MAG: Tpt1/KptA family RNA 2'-phosphotransferase [Hyperionvirus sp.]
MNCGGVIVIKRGKPDETIMVKTRAGHYGFPKGKRKKGETDFMTAVRELEEETGLIVDDIKFCVDSDTGAYYKFVENKIVYYLGLLTNEKKSIKFDLNELEEVQWIPIGTALAMEERNLKKVRRDILGSAYEVFVNCKTFTDKPEVELVPMKKTKGGSMNEMQLSKKLSWILRHGAVDIGLTVGKDGSVLVSDLMDLDDMKNVTVADIVKVVESNDKNRFTLSNDAVSGASRIRANQGHSHKVGEKINNEELLKRITIPMPICFHGTYQKFVTTIKKTGLNRMGRKHVHLTSSLTAVSGVRSNVTALVYIDMARAMADGMIFYLSDNDVILTEGINGVIDPKYISKITSK